MTRKISFSIVLLLVSTLAFAQSGPSPKPSSVSIGSITVEAFPVYKDSDGDPATAIIDANDRVILSAEGGVASLSDKLDELLAGTASETVLTDKLDELKSAITNTASETKLLNKLDEIKTNLATDTNILNKLNSLIDITASETVLTDKLDELKAAIANTASETVLINAINTAAARDTTVLTQRSIPLTPNTNRAITSTLSASTRTFIEIQPTDPSAEYWVSVDGAAVVGTSRYCQGAFYAELPKATDVNVIASTAITISVIEGGR